MRYLLDTDHVSLFQKRQATIVRRIAQLNPDQVVVSVVTAEEQIRGWFKVVRRYYHAEKVVWAYQGFTEALRFYNTVTVLTFEQLAFQHFQMLRGQKLRIGSQDLRIASIALANECVVITRNSKDFSKIPNLLIEDWTV